jgi:polyphosphate:AMP phosphotransferase
MFETAELGQKVSKSEFKKRERVLWEQLLEIQRDVLRNRQFKVIIDFAGVTGAGKSTTVNLLNKWMDARWIVTQAYAEPSYEERARPDYWRFWRDLPRRGEIGLYLSGRYSRPLLDYVYENISAVEFEEKLDRINAFERALADDGALIMKFWMHLGRKAQKRRLKNLENDPLESWRVTQKDWKHWELYERFISAADHLIQRTSKGNALWHIVEGQNYCYRSLRVGELIRDALIEHIEWSRLDNKFRSELVNRGETQQETQQETHEADTETDESSDADGQQPMVTILDSLDASKKLSKRDYKQLMKLHASRLNPLHRQALKQGISTILVLEGPDAAGKGGIIRRLTGVLDAPNYNVIATAAPTDEELNYHYLWRFWRYLPRAGHMTIFDRSWYGRVLVERVEGFATPTEWARAYSEITDFESQLTAHGIVLFKFWIDITKDEQLARFEARKHNARKRWKLTDEDWRNRQKWDKYVIAAHDMIQKTSTIAMPWTLVEGNDKLYARTKVMDTVCEGLEKAVSRTAE